MARYRGPLSNYAKAHQLALGVASETADCLLVSALWAALGRDQGMPSRLLVELQQQPHYLAAGYVLGWLFRWRYQQ
jgi:hypothetical protein